LTPGELADAAHSVASLGAFAVHVHPRDDDGKQTLAAAPCAAAAWAIRASSPGLPVGFSTLAEIEPDPERRLGLLADWTVLPDFVSVNLSEPGAVELIRALPGMGMGVEAGIWTPEDAELLVADDLAPHCLRVLVEPRDRQPGAALATVAAVDAVLDRAGIALQRVYHGVDETTWTIIEVAMAQGRDVRIGLEDTLTHPDGRLALDNAQLLAAALDLAARLQPEGGG
jgi:uncharacterized protein (DUF849 family)